MMVFAPRRFVVKRKELKVIKEILVKREIDSPRWVLHIYE